MDRVVARLEELRSEFDSSFSRPLVAESAEPNRVLCFTAENGRFAVPLTGLQAVARAGTIVPLPSRAPGMLGLTVVRAKLVPVYSLAGLMKMPAAASEHAWVALLRGTQPVALALESLAGYADRRSASQVAGAAAPRFVSGTVQLEDHLYSLLHCDELYEAITRYPTVSMKGQDPGL